MSKIDTCNVLWYVNNLCLYQPGSSWSASLEQFLRMAMELHHSTETANIKQLILLVSTLIINTYKTQPFYSSLDFVQDNPGELVPEGTFCHLLDFMVQTEDNTGRRINHPDGLPPIQTNWCPHLCHPHHFYARCPSWQPSQFILAWDRHQICWLAYPVAWLHTRWH